MKTLLSFQRVSECTSCPLTRVRVALPQGGEKRLRGQGRIVSSSPAPCGRGEGYSQLVLGAQKGSLEQGGCERENGFGSTQGKMDRPAPGITRLRGWRRTSSRRREKQRCRLALHQSKENTALFCPIPPPSLRIRNSAARLAAASRFCAQVPLDPHP